MRCIHYNLFCILEQPFVCQNHLRNTCIFRANPICFYKITQTLYRYKYEGVSKILDRNEDCYHVNLLSIRAA